MKRIAFAGSSGTGKTTLAKWVAQTYGVELNPVGSRSVAAAMGFASPYDVDAAGLRGEFQQRLINEKIAWEASHDEFVTDRTTVDNLAYLALHDVRSIDDATIERVRASLQRYAMIFYCPVFAFCSPGDDPARISDLAYQRVFDATLFGFFHSFGGAAGGDPGVGGGKVIALWSNVLADRKRTVRTIVEFDRGAR